MPRLKPFRACRLLLYTWLLTVAFWSLLPSSTIPYAQEQHHIEKTLKAGLPLTIVDGYSMTYGQDNGVTHAIYEFRLFQSPTPQNGVELLLKNEPINLTGLMKRSEAYHFSKIKNNAVRTPFFDTTRLGLAISSVDDHVDCVVCLPWFYRSDKALLTQQMQDHREIVEVRLTVDEHSVVEVWPRSIVDHTLAELEKVRQKPEAADYEEGQILEEAMQYLRDSARPLIQLEGGDMTKLEEISVPYVRGNLPSKTYHIRKAMLVRLGPALRIALFPFLLIVRSLSIVPEVLLFVLLEGGLACAGIMLSAWLRAGRPDFRQWTRNFWMTRWIPFRSNKPRRLWGPAGPVESKRMERSGWAAGGVVGLQRPKTVRLGRGMDAAV